MNNFIINKEKQPTPEQLIWIIFGIGTDQLVQQIQENKDGKYDRLFKSDMNGGDSHHV